MVQGLVRGREKEESAAWKKKANDGRPLRAEHSAIVVFHTLLLVKEDLKSEQLLLILIESQ